MLLLLLLLLFSDPFHVDDVDMISVALPNLCRDKASHQHAWLQPHYYPLLQLTCTMLCPTRQGRDDHEEAAIRPLVARRDDMLYAGPTRFRRLSM